MREEQEKAALGKFWIAGKSADTARVGVLTLEKEGAKVVLEGSLTGSEQIVDKVIFGVLTETAEKITLYNSFTTKYTETGFDGENATTIIESTEAVIGTHKEKPEFYGIQFRIPESARWFRDKTFECKNFNNDEYTISFKPYEEKKIKINDRLELIKCYQCQLGMGLWGVEELNIKKELYFKIISKEILRTDKLFDELRHLKRFIEFACQVPLEHACMSLIDDCKEHWKTHRLHVSSIFQRQKGKLDHNTVLLHIDSLPSELEKVISKWFDLKASHKEPIDRFFDALDHDGSSNVLSFLWRVSAIEEMHKIKTDKRGKTPFLKERLEDVCDRWKELIDVKNLGQHLEKIKDTRHYYAHGASDLREKSAHDWAMMRYSYFLIGLLNLEMLSLIGYTDSEALKVAGSHYGMKEYLSLSMFPGSD